MNNSKDGPIVMATWSSLEKVSREAKVLYEAVYSIILAHEIEHHAIKDTFTEKLNCTYTEQRSGCVQNPDGLKQDVYYKLQDKADEHLVELTRQWRDANNEFDKDPERRHAVESLKKNFQGGGNE